MGTNAPSAQGFRISRQQAHLWVRCLRDGHRPYRSQCALLIEGPLDRALLGQAVDSVVARHEILRTTFPRFAGMKEPVQVIHEHKESAWQEAPVSPAELPAAVEAALRRGAAPFDMDTGPPLRLTLVSASPVRNALVLSLPSLCSDRATLKNLLRHIASSYGASRERGTEDSSPPIQYADYAEWQRDLLESEDDEAALAREFWRARKAAAGGPQRLALQDRPGSGGSFEPDVLRIPVPSDLAARAAALAQEQHTSASRLAQATWVGLIARLTGEASIVLGKLEPGRRHEDLETALGLYEAPIPEPYVVGPGVSLRGLVRQIDGALEDSSAWRDYAAAEAGEEPRDALFAFDEEEEAEPFLADGVSFSLRDRFSCTTRYGLKLSCRRTRGALAAELHFDRGRIRRDNAERWARHFSVLFREAIEKPDAPLDRHAIHEPAEVRRLLVDFNEKVPRLSASRCVHELFEEQVRAAPDAVAVVCGREQWTYRLLNEKANQLARFLRSAGVRRDVRVGLCLERSTPMIEGLLGILKAGGAYVPLNPDHPKRRLAAQLTESESIVLVTQESLLDRFVDYSGLVVCLDRDRSLLDAEPGTDPERRSGMDDLVSVIYTSGSTGSPKGVATPHGALASYVAAVGDRLGLRDRREPAPLHFASVSPISADLGNTSIFPALAFGGALHLILYEVATDGDRFADYLARHPIDVLKIVPSHFRALMGAGRTDILPRRYLIFGGEPLDPELADQAARRGPGCVVFNHYGPTETTVGSLMFRVGESPIDPGCATVPIGRPIANTDIYILDPWGGPSPIGIPGELFIGGAGLARGYLRRPAETAERFVPHPFAGDVPRRLYATGDLARYLSDGAAEFLGRLDDQVKVRGYRVEPGEVTETLRRHPSVRDAMVLARGGPGESRLVAYVVPEPAAAPRREELRRYLIDRLPEYMVPAAFVVIESLPLSPTGKLNRQALPEPDDGQERERAFVAPRSRTEEVLAQVWSDLLKVAPIGVHDDFFALGGHSLLATQLISRVRSALSVEVPLRALFEGPTVAELALAVDSHPATASRAAAGPPDLVPARDEVLDEVDRLSDEEVDTMLAEILRRESPRD